MRNLAGRNPYTVRTRFLPLVIAALILPTACQDAKEPLSPTAHTNVSQAGAGMVDVIIVLDESHAPGRGAENRQRAAEVAQGLGLTPAHTYGTALFGFAATVPAARLEELRGNPLITHVELDRAVSLPQPVFEPGAGPSSGGASGVQASAGVQGVPWGVTRTGARENGGTGSGIHVYVLDTGIDPHHPDLQGNLAEGHTVFTSGCKGNPKNCPPPPNWHDDHGHGTHVAGTIGAADNGSGVVGVAPGVTLHAVKVLGANGSGSWSGIIAGVDWVAAHNVDRPRVANMSLGGSGTKHGTCTAQGLQGSTDPLHAAICNARNAGVVFTVAAMNNGGDAAQQVPAAYYDAAITISATGCRFDEQAVVQTCLTGSEAFTTWSNWGNGSDSDWLSEGSLPVAIAAPGANVLSTQMGGGHRYMSGTSMAAPHVAGGAALVLEQLGGSQAADGSALTTVRAALLGATECTETWHNVSENPHSERFLNLRSSSPIDECVEPSDPPPAAPTDLRVIDTTSSSIELAWDHESPNDSRFEIWQYTSAWNHLTYVDGNTSYTVTGLVASTSYQYSVRTVAEGDLSPWSNVVSATTLPDEGSDPPIAAFTHTCDNSDTCRFSNRSTGSFTTDAWLWNFGNGTSATTYNAHTTYTAAQTYTVTLSVTDGVGRTDSATAEITCARRGNRIRCE
jgi:subtilisin